MRSFARLLSRGIVVVSLALLQPLVPQLHAAPDKPAATAQTKRVLRESAERASFSFVPNVGQADPSALFVTRGSGLALTLRRDGLSLQARTMRKPEGKPAAFDGGLVRKPASFDVTSVNLQFIGANPAATVEGINPAASKVNFLRGSDPTKWKTNVPAYGQVRYRDLYPGIDLVYYGENQRHLEYDLVVAPGADPDAIHFHVDSDRGASIDKDGNLLLDGAAGPVTLMAPVIYQSVPKGKRMIPGSFVQIAKNEFGFQHAAYDHAKPLIIDPKLNRIYSTYAGGLHNDEPYDMTFDNAGNAYIAGWSASEDFPVSGNALQQTRQTIGSYLYDAVVLKFDPSGNLVFSTYLGGEANDQAEAIHVDPTGVVFLTGFTQSTAFPVTANAYQKTLGGGEDVFFSVLSNDGSQLLYSTYLGGSSNEAAARLIQDPTGALWIAGSASGSGLPVTSGAIQSAPLGADSGFVGKFEYHPANAQPLTVDALTFLGGSSGNAQGGFSDVQLDAAGNVYIAGITASTDYPVTANAYQKGSTFTLSGGCYNSASPQTIATVSELSADLKTLIYSTVLGGRVENQNGFPDCNQFAHVVHPDGKGNIWVVGTTGMTDFPTTPNAISTMLDVSNTAGADAYVAELTPGTTSTTLTYGTFLGGSQFDYGPRAVWDASNNIWIVATTQSTDWPGVNANTALQASNAGGYDATITELQPDGSKVLYATYLGGSQNEDIDGRATILLDSSSNVYIAGGTSSANFPTTANAYQSVIANGDAGYDNQDIYYTVLGTGAISTVGPLTGGNTGDATLTLNGAGFVQGSTCSLVSNGATIASSTAVINTAGTAANCSFPLTGAATGTYDVVLNNPDGTSFTKPGAFNVAPGSDPNIWLNVIGRSAVRFNTPSLFTVAYGNSGTVDALFVPIFISVPNGATVTLSSPELPLDPLPSSYFTTTNAPSTIQLNGATVIPITIPLIPAGGSGSVQIQLTVPSTSTDFEIDAYNWAPFASSVASLQAAVTTKAQARIDSLAQPQLILPRPRQLNADNATACLQDLIQAGLTIAANANPVSGCESAAYGLLSQSYQSFISASQPGSGANLGYNTGGIIAAGATAILKCGQLGLGATPLGAALGAAGLAAAAINAAQGIKDCGNVIEPDNPQQKKGKGVGSIDPNDKSGPLGDGSANRYTGNGKAFTYNVEFENKPTATAPASQVIVTDQLDATKLDLSTLTLGNITFGTTVINLPGTSNTYNSVYHVSSTLNVRIQGSLDTATGILKWTFTSLDPSTGQPPTDPTVGFLPPDTDGIVGQASVTFNIMPLAGLTTGASVANTASVVFDTNAPLSTPTWTNTLDVDAPTSKVTVPSSVLKTGATTPIPVTWSGTDKGSGIATYNIYVSDNSAAYSLWQSAVTTTSATYTGMSGHTYAFYSIATDGAGNVEAAKTSADSSTAIASASSTTTLKASATVASVGQSITLTATVTPPTGVTTVPTGTVSFLNGTATLGAGTLNTSGVATLTTSSLPAGAASITAAYAGDTSYGASTSTAVVITVTAPLKTTTTTLAASATAITVGQSLTLSATINPPAGSTPAPTGTVTFLNGTTSLGTGTLNASGIATLTTSSLPVGAASITAAYAGDTNYSASTSTAISIAVTSASTPDFTFTAASSSLTVTAGQSGNVTLSVTPSAGFTQAITFACSGLPSNSRCTFAPATVTPSGTSAATTVLTVSTNVASASVSSPANGIFAALLLLGTGGGLLSLKRRRIAPLLTLILLLGGAAANLLTGCGGSTPATITPKGSSAVTITATAGSTTHTSTLNLTIQ